MSFLYKEPKDGKWHLWISPRPGGFAICPDGLKPPCWFHRKMQKIILGFEWVKS